MAKPKKLKTLAIIPARGGSKGIPKKNIVDLAGQPLISYCLTAAQKSRYVDRIILTTDNNEIAKVGRAWGAETPFLRPAELAQDNSPTIPVIEHALLWLEKNENYRPEFVLLLQPPWVFVTAEHIDKVFQLIVEKKADSGITMINSPRIFHPYHVRLAKANGAIEFEQPDLHYKHPNRQSDPARYAFGNLYWFKRDLFLKEKKIEVGRRVGLEIDHWSAHDIDSPFDLEVAQFLMASRPKENE